MLKKVKNEAEYNNKVEITFTDGHSKEVEYEEDLHICRVCRKEFDFTSGDDFVMICDQCAENYNLDQIWTDFDTGKILEDEIQDLELKDYFRK